MAVPSPAAPQGQGIAASAYAKSKKELVGLINEIRSSGASLVLDLPRIAVIGKQSAGKSSLIEAISAIKVPRDSGTCTRCPLEVRLQSSSKPWTCTVSLRFETAENGDPLPAVKEIIFGTPITDPTRVELVLRRAQLAILNPSVADPRRFVDLDLSKLADGALPCGSTKQLAFSPNVVCVDIQGENVTDLAFVDLPGIVVNGEQAMIDLVRGLVEKYVVGNCLILVALTIGDDIENQSAALIAKTADPEGKRTIGVLTKPDLLPKGEEDAWLRILRNQRYPLLHGYYCTKQPNAEELKASPTFEDARRAEVAFFRKGHWAKLDVETKQRLGTTNLTAALSDRLSQFIRDKLPELIAEINSAYATVLQDTRELPPKPSDDPAQELLHLCTEFSAALKQFSDGTAPHLQLVQGAREIFAKFRLDIRATVPHFVPYEKRKSQMTKDQYKEPEFIASELDHGMEVDELGDVVEDRLRMDLDDARQLIKSTISWELPLNVPCPAKSTLIAKSVKLWPSLSFDCLDHLLPIIKAVIAELIQRYFGRFENSPLRGHVSVVVASEVKRFSDLTRQHLEWFMSLEEVPYTQNDHYYTATRQKILTHYRELRSGFKAENVGTSTMNSLLSYLAAANLPSNKAYLGRLFNDDFYHEELTLMAETRAYFQIAYKRVIDEVPRIINIDLIRPLSARLQHELIKGLKLQGEGATENARQMLSEASSIALRREDLRARRARLEGARNALRSFGVN